jgi:pimeloyl-ACP methyl ester carboxylesterase
MRFAWFLSFVPVLLFSCKTTHSSFLSSSVNAVDRIENEEVRRLWLLHIEKETKLRNTSGLALQPDCQPRYYPAHPEVPRKGMVMYFHGFTACPQQYYEISEILALKGYDVFLPLMPGQGRAPTGNADYVKDLPSKTTLSKPTQHRLYVEFVNDMNAIAKASTGEKVLTGLSGGAGLATGAVVAGQSAEGNLWTRLLLYSPYYRIPGILEKVTEFLGLTNPGTKVLNDWGEGCRANRLRSGGRNGYCQVPDGAAVAMVQYGEDVAKELKNVTIPIQIVGVEKDKTADNTTIRKTFETLKNARFCFYPLGVPHSIVNPTRDLLPDTPEFATIRERSLPSGPPYEWVDAMNKDSVAFLTEGKWFPSSGVSEVESSYGNKIPMCQPAQLRPRAL